MYCIVSNISSVSLCIVSDGIKKKNGNGIITGKVRKMLIAGKSSVWNRESKLQIVMGSAFLSQKINFRFSPIMNAFKSKSMVSKEIQTLFALICQPDPIKSNNE